MGSLPGTVWALGLGSLFMDTSSELVHSLLPLLLTGALGASVATVGLLEGLAEATAALTKVVSGTLSDRLTRRKGLILAGYGLAALTKPVFPLAISVPQVLAARFLDRVGKGIRGAPRDALIADVTPAEQRGAAYGLRQSLDSVGAVLGPALAILLMAALGGDLRASLWIAAIPAAAAVGVLALFIREPEAPSAATTGSRPSLWSTVGSLGREVWIIVAVGGVFTLARFSEAFLILRADSVGIPAGWVPMVMVVLSVCYAAGAYPAGLLADRVSPRGLLGIGLAALVLADGVLAAATAPLHVGVGAALWGLHLALTQGLLSKLVADAAPSSARGAAFGVYNLATGLALLGASVTAGWLWDTWGPATTFVAGAALATAAALGLPLVRPRRS